CRLPPPLHLPYTTLFRSHPVEDLDGREDADEHREQPESAAHERALPGDEQVVTPGEESDEGDADGAEGDGPVAESVLARKRADRSEEHTSELQSPYDLVC